MTTSENSKYGSGLTLIQDLAKLTSFSRQNRLRAAVDGKLVDNCTHGTVIRLAYFMQTRPMGNVDHVEDIHDNHKSYYKVARKRFVDNVCLHGAGYHLITGPETPLKLFSPAWVGSLTPEQIEEVAGEDAVLKRKRVTLKKEIGDLEAGRKILN